MTDTRDPSIDVLRGLAILTMVEANMAPYSLHAPHPMLLRAIGTFAAPTFVFLAGLMVSISRRPARMSHALRRSALILFVGVAIDVACWRIAPFVGFDVLYLIGFALPAAVLCLALDARAHAVVAISIIGVTPFLHDRFGYGPLLTDPGPRPLWLHWLVDGWFPVFPWLGVALLGTWYGRAPAMNTPRARLVGGGALVLSGVVALAIRPPAFITRGGYSELFYPPTIGLLSATIGFSLVLLSLVPRLSTLVPLGWIATYGRASLVIYVAHTIFIAFVFERLGRQPLHLFLALYACHVAVLWGIARFRGAFTPALPRDGLRSNT
jgi:uncharacterized membrane protein